MVSSRFLLSSSLTLLIQATSSSAFATSPLSSSRVVERSRQVGPLLAANNDNNNNPFGFVQGLFSGGTAVAQPKTPAIPDVVVDSDYTLAAVFASIGLSSVLLGHDIFTSVIGGLFVLLATLFAVQASRIRFVFDGEAFELKNIGSGDDEQQLADSGENFVVGGANRWKYDSFVNYEFFPKGSPVPILVYFKEVQTVKEDGSNDGQIHFFPAIANCKQLEEQFELRGCAKIRD